MTLLENELSQEQLLGTTSFDADWKVIHSDGKEFKSDEQPVPRAIKENDV
jgi:hypothetical protein